VTKTTIFLQIVSSDQVSGEICTLSSSSYPVLVFKVLRFLYSGLGTSLLWRSIVAFNYLKVKSAKCLCLLLVVLILLFWSLSWSCKQWSWSCYFGLGLKNLFLFTSVSLISAAVIIVIITILLCRCDGAGCRWWRPARRGPTAPQRPGQLQARSGEAPRWTHSRAGRGEEDTSQPPGRDRATEETSGRLARIASDIPALSRPPTKLHQRMSRPPLPFINTSYCFTRCTKTFAFSDTFSTGSVACS